MHDLPTRRLVEIFRKALIPALTVFIVASCLVPPDYFPPAGRSPGQATTLVGPEGENEGDLLLLFEIYTIRDDSPGGYLRLGLLDPASLGFVGGFTLEEDESPFDDLRLFRGWIRAPLVAHPFTIRNSVGSFARSMDNEPIADYRRLSVDPSEYWAVDSRRRHFAYRELVRHWESSDGDYTTLEIPLQVRDFRGPSLDASLEVAHEYQLSSEQYLRGVSRFSQTSQGRVVLRPEELRVVPSESRLSFVDRLSVTIRSDFYASLLLRFDYAAVPPQSPIEVPLARNRELFIRYRYAEDEGGLTGPLDRTVRTASIGRDDFVDEDVAEQYFASFDDRRIDRYNFGALHLDGEDPAEGTPDFSSALTYRVGGPVVELYGSLALVGSDRPINVDRLEFRSFLNAEPGRTYLAKSSDGGFILFVIDRIEEMS